MPRQKQPSEKLLRHAAELRATGATWEAVAKKVRRALRTVLYWPQEYPERWAAALLEAERRMASQADSESVLALRKLLLSQDEKVRWHAAKCLIARRLDRDKIEQKTPSTTSLSLSIEATRFAAYLDGKPDEELSALAKID